MIKHGLLSTPGAAIKAGTSPTASHSAFEYAVNGVFKTKAAADFPALTGTIADDYSAVYSFLIDSAGTVTVVKSDDVALADDIDVLKLVTASINSGVTGTGKVLVSSIVVTNETGSTFTAGTTALDAANTTVTYIDWNVA